MKKTFYIYPTLSLQRASEIFKIGTLTKKPLGSFLVVSTRQCVSCTEESFQADNTKHTAANDKNEAQSLKIFISYHVPQEIWSRVQQNDNFIMFR